MRQLAREFGWKRIKNACFAKCTLKLPNRIPNHGGLSSRRAIGELNGWGKGWLPSILIRAFLAEGKIQMGSRLKTACTNPLNNQSSNALNATLKNSTKLDTDTCQTTQTFSDGSAETASTDLALSLARTNPYKKDQIGK
jgi:hypothetical protein